MKNKVQLIKCTGPSLALSINNAQTAIPGSAHKEHQEQKGHARHDAHENLQLEIANKQGQAKQRQAQGERVSECKVGQTMSS